MSTPTENNSGEEKSSRARRFNNNSRRRRPINTNGERKDHDENTTEQKESVDRPRRKRLPDLPVPPELIGTEVTGKIFDILRKYNFSYGFILINSETSPKNQKPKIYFNVKDYEEKEFIARKGYEVKFKIGKDEKDRLCATNISLTPEGRVAAELREERIAKFKEDEAAALGSGESNSNTKLAGERKRSERSEKYQKRKELYDTIVPLTVTCDDKAETITIDTKIYQSIGKLKHACAEGFGVPLQYSIYCQRTNENPEGILLNKTLLKEMKAGDKVHLGPLVTLPPINDLTV